MQRYWSSHRRDRANRDPERTRVVLFRRKAHRHVLDHRPCKGPHLVVALFKRTGKVVVLYSAEVPQESRAIGEHQFDLVPAKVLVDLDLRIDDA